MSPSSVVSFWGPIGSFLIELFALRRALEEDVERVD